MITIVHGGQSGVDRGAHEAALANGWLVAGYMTSDARDEFGPIPPDVARCLWAHEKPHYAARTEANVRCCAALLVIVRDKTDPRATPGTAKTIDFAAERHLPRMVADPTDDPGMIARWLWRDLITFRTLKLPLEAQDPVTDRLMVAGPRESKWPEARVATAALLRSVCVELRMLAASPPRSAP